MSEHFKVGGSKDKVFRFLRNHGFVMSKWSDKHWTRADGVKLHIYGTGSMAIIYDKSGTVIADEAIDSAVAKTAA